MEQMTTYRQAGVDLESARQHLQRIEPLVTATWGPQVVGSFGGFAGGIEVPRGYRRPVLVMTTDGVGTKLEIARQTHRWAGVGHDLVAMCLDDLAAWGARPLALVDYLAVGALDPSRDAAIITSVAEACTLAGCALLGGETAEHPGVMAPDQVDLAGSAVGIVEAGEEVTGATVGPGDQVIGVLSPNLRSNGYSLVRAVFRGSDLDAPFPGERASMGEVLMRPSVIYTPAVLAAVGKGGVHGLAHVTGGGISANLVRALPEGCRAVIDPSSWVAPNVFEVVQRTGSVSTEEMWRTFNMGIGYCLVVDKAAVESLLSVVGGFGHTTALIGHIEGGERGVSLMGGTTGPSGASKPA